MQSLVGLSEVCNEIGFNLLGQLSHQFLRQVVLRRKLLSKSLWVRVGEDSDNVGLVSNDDFHVETFNLAVSKATIGPSRMQSVWVFILVLKGTANLQVAYDAWVLACALSISQGAELPLIEEIQFILHPLS